MPRAWIGETYDLGGAEFNLRALGAKLDGVTSDVGPVREGLKRIESIGGGILRHPGGDLFLGAQIDVPSYTRFLGPGLRVGTTVGKAARIIRGFDGTVLNCAGTNGAHKAGIEISGITIDGQDVASGFTGTALDISYTSGFRSSYLEVYRNIGAAVLCEQTWDAAFERPWIRRCGEAGIRAAWLIDNTDDETSDTIVLLYPHFESNYATHLLIRASGSFAFPPRWVKLVEPKIHGFPSASGENITEPLMEVLASEDLHVLGGQFQGNGDTGGTLRIGDSSRAIVLGARIQGDGTTNATVPFVLRDACSRGYFVVSLGSTSSPQKATLESGSINNRVIVTASDGAAPTGPLDQGTGNVVTNEQDGFLRVLSGRTIQRPQQDFADGDTTPSVATGNHFRANNTSTTTITNFDDGIDGQEIYVIASNGLTTIQNNATIQLQGGVNFTMAALNSLKLYRHAGVWNEFARKT